MSTVPAGYRELTTPIMASSPYRAARRYNRPRTRRHDSRSNLLWHAVAAVNACELGSPNGPASRGIVLPLCYRCGMAVRKKRSISMPPDLDAEIAAAAAEAGLSYSAWLADTARKEFTIRPGLAAVGQFEQDHGAFTPEELSAADE